MACVHGVWRKVFPKIDFFHYEAKLFVIAIFYVTFIAGKKVLDPNFQTKMKPIFPPRPHLGSGENII